MFGKTAKRREKAEYLDRPLKFDSNSGELADRHRVIRLEPKAAGVLKTLAEADGRLVSRQEILDRIWGESSGSDEALTQAIAQIRRAFEKLGKSSPIETLAKRGYRLTAALEIRGSRNFTPRDERPRYSLVIWLTLFAALLVFAYARPHALRHFVRHNLGMGAPQAPSGAAHPN